MCAQNSLDNFPPQIQTAKIPPDGNWGWAVMIGFGIFNVRAFFQIFYYKLYYIVVFVAYLNKHLIVISFLISYLFALVKDKPILNKILLIYFCLSKSA